MLSDVSRMLRQEFNRRVRHLNLTQAQWRTLAQLAYRQGLKQAELADILEIQPITLARLVDRLQESGWVERRPDPADRRAFRLYLTDAAQPIIAQISVYAEETRQVAMNGLPEGARDQLLGYLRSIRENLLTAATAGDASRPAAEGRTVRHG